MCRRLVIVKNSWSPSRTSQRSRRWAHDRRAREADARWAAVVQRAEELVRGVAADVEAERESLGGDSLADDVYITIDVDGMDPAIMPATGTPEPGGLSWAEITRLLRATAERRRIVAADVVELSPIPGMIAPNFLCAKLIYKMITYRFAAETL